jgi:hypothetical protein
MTASPHTQAEMAPLVEIIELKWLLVGEGVHLHVERMLSDSDYARRALDHAAASTRPALCAAAARLRNRLLLQSD